MENTDKTGYANCCGSSGADGYSNYAYGASGEFKAYSNQSGNFDLPLNASGDNKSAKAHDVAGYTAMTVDNNMSAVIDALNKNGNMVSPSINRNDLIAKLASLYKTNEALFTKVLKSVPFNPSANNYTTDKNFIAKINAQVNKLKK